MKTFSTEKHNIPEGATHYSNETRDMHFAWRNAKGESQVPSVDLEWVIFSPVREWKPIPQTNIETPEEKEALDSIGYNLINPREPSKPVITKVEWDGEGLPPVGVECWFNFKSRAPEKCTVKYIGDKICVYDDESGKEYSILLSSVEFSRLETEAEQIERERLEASYDLYVEGQLAVGVLGYQDFDDFTNDEMQVRFYLAIVDKTNYRKES